MDECKEQMLIRRDVAKDEHAPSPAEAVPPRIGHPVDAWNAQSLDELIPPREWVETAQPRAMAPFPPLAQARKEAYLRWRTLLDALADG
jgi:hypothetical protein